ncbi:MAG: TIGR02099 family protein, partial [Burkholderiales bacterium]|nr:TIGR02099 family protein [Burkholderiales bacterium]
VAWGNTMFAKAPRPNAAEAGASWRVLRGGIGVNVSAPEPESGVTVNANMHALNVDAWRVLAQQVNRSSSASGTNPTTSSTTSAAASEDKADSEAAADMQVAQYLDPDVLAARADELVVLGKKLDDVVVGASHQKGVWQANINSHQVAGYLTWYEGKGRGLGKVTTRLSSLIIPESAAQDVTELLDGKETTTRMPSLDIMADNFELFNKKLGHLELIANNTRVAGQREWRISKLLLDNPDAQLQASGKWLNREGEGGMTSLSYELAMKDAGKMLERFGFAHVLRGGEGQMKGDISWKGMPFALDIPSLSGHLKLDMTAGQFLKVEPGAAKLLSVLSLQSLPKLLKLDFHDVFSEGFAFDGISANAQINKGVLETKDLKMRSVQATVAMEGSADIAHETQNLYVVVMPEFNVGTASVVYALAVNPVVGLGSYLAQLFLRDPLTKALTFQYQITGSWKEPNVAKVEARIPKAVLDATKPPEKP